MATCRSFNEAEAIKPRNLGVVMDVLNGRLTASMRPRQSSLGIQFAPQDWSYSNRKLQ